MILVLASMSDGSVRKASVVQEKPAINKYPIQEKPVSMAVRQNTDNRHERKVQRKPISNGPGGIPFIRIVRKWCMCQSAVVIVLRHFHARFDKQKNAS